MNNEKNPLTEREINAQDSRPDAKAISEKKESDGIDELKQEMAEAAKENIVPKKKAGRKKAERKTIREVVDESISGKKTPKKTASPEVTDKREEKRKIVTKAETIESKKKSAIASGQKEIKKKPIPRRPLIKKETSTTDTKITFALRFHTKFGQSLYITGAHNIFGNKDVNKALPMQYLNEELWTLTIDITNADIPVGGVIYNYLLKNEDDSLNYDWGNDKVLTPSLFASEEILILDAWNHPGYFENAFYTEPFKQVLLTDNYTPVKTSAPKIFTHTFKVKAPLLIKGQTLFLTGSCIELGNWSDAGIVLMSRREDEDFFSAKINLAKTAFPVMYKYGVYDTEAKKIIKLEGGNNRILSDVFANTQNTIVNDGFAILPSTTWKGAGVAIPVFSLRSDNSWGVGEFADIKLLADWAKTVGLKLIQILPVNDTTATNTWMDSYPYAAISAFALHPMYLNLQKATNETNSHLLDAVADEQTRLNKLDSVDYEAVNNLKWQIIKQIYPLQKDALFASKGYQQFFKQNKSWLVPYAAFCYFRNKYNTADFNQWSSHKTYSDAVIEELQQPASQNYDDIAIHFFVQYYLHLQLKDATQYAHDNGIIVKGDIPIGVYRYGADAWQRPELYHMDVQAGAPPDDFAVTGQNWGFPTYNWEKMREDGFAWWKQRFEQMSYYFDAFRLDHILGFFRIWSIPVNSLEGIMGHFEPSIPVHINEFNKKGIKFDQDRYCRPYITEQVLNKMFGDQQEHVKYTFLNNNGSGKYQLKPEYATQQRVENYFSRQQDNAHNQWLKKQLFSLISNVILFEAKGSQGRQFHFRFAMETTASFEDLDWETQNRLRELYTDYFFRRQDNFWMHAALQKLPALKRETNMLVCGEDLGLVPGCVPEVMRELGILSLEIQRMPKDPKREFFHPADAPYLSVITPSTHDLSTIRGWWEEDRERTQRFYNSEIGQWGEAPYFCDAWVNKAIVIQHLYSPAMWSVFLLQDILGIDVKIRRPYPHEERINDPANPKHYWRYRMHISLEDLNNATAFNDEFSEYVKASGRA